MPIAEALEELARSWPGGLLLAVALYYLGRPIVDLVKTRLGKGDEAAKQKAEIAATADQALQKAALETLSTALEVLQEQLAISRAGEAAARAESATNAAGWRGALERNSQESIRTLTDTARSIDNFTSAFERVNNALERLRERQTG